MYLLYGSPTDASGHNTVLTRGYDEVGLLRDSYKILKMLATEDEWQNTHVAYVSRTTEPTWAKKCLQLLQSRDGLSLDQQGPIQVRTCFTSIPAAMLNTLLLSPSSCALKRLSHFSL
jgi:Acid Phosphatase